MKMAWQSHARTGGLTAPEVLHHPRRLPRRHVLADERVRPRGRHALDVRRTRARARLRPATPRRTRPRRRRPRGALPGRSRPGRCSSSTPTRSPPSSSSPCSRAPGGMWIYPARCLDFLARLAREHGALVIHDEIATGFWRTGPALGAHHGQERPDIVCVGKALTGGYLTLAAVLCTGDVAERVSSSPAGAMMHGPTFMGNPLACAVACANLDLLEKNDAAGRRRGDQRRTGRGPRAGHPARLGPRRPDDRCRRGHGAGHARGRRGGHRGRPRPRCLGAPVPQPRLHDAALRHRPARTSHSSPKPSSARWRRCTDDAVRRLAAAAGGRAGGGRPHPSTRAAPPLRAGHRPRRQRLPRAGSAPAGGRGRGRGRPGVRRRRRSVATRDRDPEPARGARARSRRVHRLPRRAGVLDRLPRQPVRGLRARRRRHAGRL